VKRVARKPKKTSTSVAARASAVLRSPRASKAVKSVAGSALAQREKAAVPVRKFKAGKDL